MFMLQLFDTANEIHIPVGEPVQFKVHTNDVIHSFWVPPLGDKLDLIPNQTNVTWLQASQPGTYRGQCAELCGMDHGFMPIVVEVVEPEKYAQWIAGQKKTATAAATEDPNKQWNMVELRTQGEKVYAANCVACHQATGMGVPNTFPALSGSKVATGDKSAHLNIVVNGKPGTAMAPFKHLSDVEIAAVVTFERNTWDNKVGDFVTPADVKALRK